MSSTRGEGARIIGLEKKLGLHLVPKDTEIGDKGMLQEREKEYKNQKKEYELLKTYFLYIKEKNSTDEKKRYILDLEEHLEEAKVSIDLMLDIIENTKKESTGSDNENYWITAKQYHKECAQFLKKAQKIIDEQFPEEKIDLEKLLSEERERQERNAVSNIKERINDKPIRLSSPKPGKIKPLFRPPASRIANPISEKKIVTPPLPTNDEEIILGDGDFEVIEDNNPETTVEPPPLPDEEGEVINPDPFTGAPKASKKEIKKMEWPGPLFNSIKDKKITLPGGAEVDFDIPELPIFNVQISTQEERKALGNRQIPEDNSNTLIYGITLKSGDKSGSKYSIGFTYDKNGELTEYTLYDEHPSLTKRNTPTHMSSEETRAGTPDQFKSILEKFLDYARQRVAQERLVATDKIEPQTDSIPSIPEQQKTKEELEQELDVMIAKAKSLTLDSMTKRETYEQHLIDMERINSEMKKLEKKFIDKFEEYTATHPQNPKKYETNLYKNFEIGDENLDSPWFENIDKKPPKTDGELEDEFYKSSPNYDEMEEEEDQPDANPSRHFLQKDELKRSEEELYKKSGFFTRLGKKITAAAVFLGLATIVGDNKGESDSINTKNLKPNGEGVKNVPEVVSPVEEDDGINELSRKEAETKRRPRSPIESSESSTPTVEIKAKKAPLKEVRGSYASFVKRKTASPANPKPREGLRTNENKNTEVAKRPLSLMLEKRKIDNGKKYTEAEKQTGGIVKEVHEKMNNLFDALDKIGYGEQTTYWQSSLRDSIRNILKKSNFPGDREKIRLKIIQAINDANSRPTIASAMKFAAFVDTMENNSGAYRIAGKILEDMMATKPSSLE